MDKYAQTNMERTQSTCWFSDMDRDFLMKIGERLDLVTGLNVAKKDPASIRRPHDTFESEMMQASCISWIQGVPSACALGWVDLNFGCSTINQVYG